MNKFNFGDREINLRDFFIPGKISIVMDVQAGSSGKGVITSFLAKHGDPKFLCTTNSRNASHTCVDGDFKQVFKVLPSGSQYHKKIEKVYIGGGASFMVDDLFKEMEAVGIPAGKVGISPLASIIQDIDAAYERGEVDFDGNPPQKKHDGTIKTGSTCSGAGAARARKVLRNKNVLLARDIEQLHSFVYDIDDEIIDRLENGQSGLFELCQGYQLGYSQSKFYPNTTSRSVGIAAGFDDLNISPFYVGNVLANLRTYPIRINSKKYLEKGTGRHLTWDEVRGGKFEFEEIDSYSGGWYPDQHEISWSDITQMSGSPQPIEEVTTLTRLPRRIFGFSKYNLYDFIRHNQVHNTIYIAINFANYVDWDMYQSRDYISEKFRRWMEENIDPVITKFNNVKLKFIGTSPQADDYIVLE